MKKIHIDILLWSAVGLLLLFTSCEKDPSVYENEKCYLRFVYANAGDSTLGRSFAYGAEEQTEDTVWLKVSIMGFTSDRDRPFMLKQVKTGGQDAVAGTHYVDFNDARLAAEYYYVPKGETEREVPVVLKRDASLKTNDYTLRVTIEANEYFALGSKEYLYKTVTLADRLVKPDNWDRYVKSLYGQTILGTWGENKHKFIVRVTNEKWDDEYILNTWKYYLENDNGYIDYIKNLLKSELEKYNADPENNGPLKDGDVIVSFD